MAIRQVLINVSCLRGGLLSHLLAKQHGQSLFLLLKRNLFLLKQIKLKRSLFLKKQLLFLLLLLLRLIRLDELPHLGSRAGTGRGTLSHKNFI